MIILLLLKFALVAVGLRYVIDLAKRSRQGRAARSEQGYMVAITVGYLSFIAWLVAPDLHAPAWLVTVLPIMAAGLVLGAWLWMAVLGWREASPKRKAPPN